MEKLTVEGPSVDNFLLGMIDSREEMVHAGKQARLISKRS